MTAFDVLEDPLLALGNEKGASFGVIAQPPLVAVGVQMRHGLAGQVLEAQVLLRTEPLADAIVILAEALALSKSKACLNLQGWDPVVMADLCVLALENGLETEFVQTLVCQRKLFPERAPLHVRDWPWAIRIRTLGRVVLEIDGKPVELSAGHGKPVTLLRALIALGNEAREDELVKIVGGDSARLADVLDELRSLLACDDAIIVEAGRVSLSRRLCWVDAWALDETMKRLEAGDASSDREHDRWPCHHHGACYFFHGLAWYS